MSNPFEEYQVVELNTDLNPGLIKGLKGVVLMIHDESTVEVEFVKEDGTNYEYEDQFTFTLKTSVLSLVPARI